MTVYLDACVLLAYIFGPEQNQRQYSEAKRVFDQIKRGDFSCVISHLVLQEILNVFRRRKGGEYQYLIGLTEENQIKYIKDESTELFHKLLSELLKSDKFIFNVGNEINAENLFSDGLELLTRKFGIVRFHRKCYQCNSEVKFSVYSGLSPADISHVLLAQQMDCDQFLTFDRGFRILEDEETIQPLQIIVR